MRTRRSNLSAFVSLLFIGAVVFIANVVAMSGISGSVHNSEYSVGFSEFVENAESTGVVNLLPDSISEAGVGHPISSSGNTNHTSNLFAAGDGKSVSTSSTLQEDAAMQSVVDTTWGQQIVMGGSTDDCPISNSIHSLSQFTEIVSHPGYLTFPTSSIALTSITTGMTYQAFNNGNPLSDKFYVPGIEFREPRITLGAMKSEYDDVYMRTALNVAANW